MDILLQTLFVSHDRMALRWDLSEPAGGPVSFTVERSGNAVTGYQSVAVTDKVALIDKVDLMSKFKPFFYRVRAVISGVEVISNVASIQSPPNDEVFRLQRRERFQLAKYDGIPALLYTKRRSGRLCPRCVPSNASQGDMGVECSVCFGTGFRGGYYPPLPIYVAVQSLVREGTNLTENYVKESRNDNLWTSNWSIINPEDVIIEMTPPNNVWRVTGVQRTERRRAGIRQLLTTSLSDKGSPIYKLPIPSFAFPSREDIFFFDHEEGKDFDTLFQELLDAYAENQNLPHEDDPVAQQPQPSDQNRERNPGSGYYS